MTCELMAARCLTGTGTGAVAVVVVDYCVVITEVTHSLARLNPAGTGGVVAIVLTR